MKQSITQINLIQYLETLLATNLFLKDYAHNGLQVEGKEKIHRIAFAVSASKSAIDAAVELKADALIVHHGLFWRGSSPSLITGAFGRRIRPLIQHNINLLAYHLPLDAHTHLGNAAQLGQQLGIISQEPFGLHDHMPLGIQGILTVPTAVSELQQRLSQLLHHSVILSSSNPTQKIQKIGIITGGANNYWKDAVKSGLEVFITGEMKEYDWHDAQEAGLHMMAGGHHATEVWGVKALMHHLQEKWQLECHYIELENPA